MIAWFYMSSFILSFVSYVKHSISLIRYKFLCFIWIHKIHFCSNSKISPTFWFSPDGSSMMSVKFQPRCPEITEITPLIPYSCVHNYLFHFYKCWIIFFFMYSCIHLFQAIFLYLQNTRKGPKSPSALEKNIL